LFIGFFLNCIGVGLVLLWTFILGNPVLGIEFGVIPNWAIPNNVTI
jgi:hypothetical protein